MLATGPKDAASCVTTRAVVLTSGVCLAGTLRAPRALGGYFIILRYILVLASEFIEALPSLLPTLAPTIALVCELLLGCSGHRCAPLHVCTLANTAPSLTPRISRMLRKSCFDVLAFGCQPLARSLVTGVVAAAPAAPPEVAAHADREGEMVTP